MIQKKNKEFDNKCNALRNRIQILKKEEEIYKNQLKYIKKKEEQDRIIQNDKIKMKIELEKIKMENNKELQKKKERVQRFKMKAKNRLEEKKNENQSQKKRKYQSALNDKYLMKCIIEQINTQQNNKNCYQHAKIRQQFNEFETNRVKRNIIKENKEQLEHENNLRVLKNLEKKMMNACNELESIEKKCLESLNKTKDFNLKYLENSSDSKSKYFFSPKRFVPRKHLNKSVEMEYNLDKKFNNSVLSPSIKSQKHDDLKDKFNNTTFTQSSSVSNFRNKRSKQYIRTNADNERNDNSGYRNKNVNKTFIKNNNIEKKISKIDKNKKGSNNKNINVNNNQNNKQNNNQNKNKNNNHQNIISNNKNIKNNNISKSPNNKNGKIIIIKKIKKINE